MAKIVTDVCECVCVLSSAFQKVKRLDSPKVYPQCYTIFSKVVFK